MSDEIALGGTAPLPARPSEWFADGCAVHWNGYLASVRTDPPLFVQVAIKPC